VGAGIKPTFCKSKPHSPLLDTLDLPCLGVGCGGFYQGTIMTKKHFEAIAKILKAQNANLALVMELAAYFEFTNPNFDAERFVKACLNSK